MKNRLQFRHHNEIFDTREQAIEYIYRGVRYATEPSMAAEDKSYGYSLFAEPTVLRYKNDEDVNNPHIVIAIGSNTNEDVQYDENAFCIIDIDKTESEIQNLWEELEKAVRSLSIITLDTNTLKLYSEKTEDGTVLSGDVVVAESHVFDNVVTPNRIMSTETGLYTYVNLTYDEERETFTFVVSNAETGELDKTSVKIENNYLVGGEYKIEDESLHLTMRDGNEITISLESLIDEWTVEGEASKTPIVLTREKVLYGNDEAHEHTESWQDVLRGDVRISNIPNNVLKKTADGRSLYVRISTDNNNIVFEKEDGIFATANLSYISNENALVFTSSNYTGGTTTEKIQLNGVKLFDEVRYDAETEELVVIYINDVGERVEVRIPVSGIIVEWDVDNLNHNVELHKDTHVPGPGPDLLSADVKIFEGHDNILEDLSHQLYVKGTADNIKYGDDSNVKKEIDELYNTANELINDVNAVSGDTARRLIDIFNNDHSIDVDKTDALRPIIKVNLSTEVEDGKENIIKLNNDGLYVGVDLIYEFNEESGSNQLIFKTTNETKVFDLKTNSVVDRIYYDPVREAIIVEYTINGHRMPDVVIPVGDLINEWRVSESTDGAIKLLKIRESGSSQDILYAESIISDHDDNILKNDNGSLYVSNRDIEINKANINMLIQMERASEGRIDALETNLEGEIARAEASEATLDTKISNETLRAVAAENTLSENLASEIERATAAETTLDEKIDGETARARLTETALDEKIDAETSRATSEETRIEGKLDSEITRATSKEEALDHAISAETIARISGDTELGTRISNEIQAERTARISADTAIDIKIANERTARESGDTELRTLINAESTARVNADTALGERITNEANERQSADSALQNAIASEAETRASQDDLLRQKINNDISNASSELENLIEAERAARISADTIEALTRENADTEIRTALNGEIARSTSVDEEYNLRINDNASNLANEIVRANNAESGLSYAIHLEEDRATVAENALRTAIDNETSDRITADETLQANIDAEAVTRANADNALSSAINSAETRAMREEQILSNSLTDEIQRSTSKDNELETKINNEINARQSGHTEIRNELNSESIRAREAEGTLTTNLATEIQRSTDKDNALDAAIIAEIAERQAADAALQSALSAATHTIEDSTTIHIDKTNPSVWTAHVVASNGDKNIISSNNVDGGLYATADITYDAATNTINLFGTNGILLSQQKLGAGSLLDSITYDPTEKNLVITYHNADGVAQVLQFGVAELFNEWEVKNPSEGSAIELTKVANSGETGAIDYVYGRVLLTKAVELGDGDVEYGDNAIRIVNNGLYVSGSAITEAKETVECTTHELKQVEMATFGHQVTQECGSGFTYTPKATACVISAATSMFNADEILDSAVCSLSAKSEETDEKVECLKKALSVTQQNVMGIIVPECGMNNDQTLYRYQPHVNAHVISAATSMDEADLLLDSSINTINTNIDTINTKVDCMSGETKAVERVLGIVGNCSESISYPTTSGCLLNSATTYANADEILEATLCDILRMRTVTNTPTVTMRDVDGHFEADVRLSHGNTKGMTDGELTISGLTDSEFTDTNVLRQVALDDYVPETQYNGLYLSNDWDCGEYTENGEGTPGEKYKTDDSTTAQNIFQQKFRNGVRYTI